MKKSRVRRKDAGWREGTSSVNRDVRCVQQSRQDATAGLMARPGTPVVRRSGGGDPVFAAGMKCGYPDFHAIAI